MKIREFSLVIACAIAGLSGPAALPLWAQKNSSENSSAPDALSLEALFSKGQFETEPVPNMQWSKRSSTYFKLDKTADGSAVDIVRYDPASGGKQVFVPSDWLIPGGQQKPLKIDAFDLSSDEARVMIYTNSQRVWRRPTRGDYWVLDLATRALHPLGGDAAPASLMFAKFSSDGNRVAFVRQNNLYVENVKTHEIVQVTTDGSTTVINGTADWVNEEELDLRDCYRWSPEGLRLLYWQFDTSDVPKFHLVNNTDSSEPQITSFAYPKVGQKNSATRLGVISANGGAVRWLELPGDPREHYLPHAEWTPDGKYILVQQFNRLQTDLKLFLVDPSTGFVRHLMTEHDDAWLENENPVRWLDGGTSILWISHRSGWRHVYRVPIDTASTNSTKLVEPMPITRGDFDVMEVEGISVSDNCLYYAASPDNATQRHLYRVKLDGSGNERISPSTKAGWYRSEISPDGKWAVRSYSTFTTPPIVELVRQTDLSVVQTLASNRQLKQKLDQLDRPNIEFFKVNIGNGVELDAWSMRPATMKESDKLPLVMHVYGEPHGQTVRDAWPGPRGLWHWFLANKGFLVASVDNRGTNVPRGRDWRKVVHRQIGILAPQEQAAALRQLLDRWPQVDRSRVGIWGWSGGGSMSLNAIFRYPELYHAAVSIAPVADQRLYDTIYQERYMGLPAENATGYKDGSPITHAHKLQGELLIIHGTGDDNCHYQGTERLMNELISQGKQFSVLPYPNRTHSIREGQNTEVHLWSTMTHFFEKSLRVGL